VRKVQPPSPTEQRELSLVSVVIPAFNEAENLPHLFERLSSSLAGIDFQIIVVDDSSKDDTPRLVRKYHDQHPQFHYVLLGRNIGNQLAMWTGIRRAQGDCIICMDADLQHPPEVLPEMIEKWKQGFDVVQTSHDYGPTTHPWRRVVDWLYYRVISALSGTDIRPGGSDFRLIDRTVVEKLSSIELAPLYMRAVIPRLNFKTTRVGYTLSDRYRGETRHSVSKLIRLALSGLIVSMNSRSQAEKMLNTLKSCPIESSLSSM